MKVIFLDIDGVICTPRSLRLSGWLGLPMERQRFDPAALFWLRWLVRRSGAELALCSSWRDAFTMDDPVSRALIHTLYGRLARNRTPLSHAVPQLPSGDKGAEIAAWLAAHDCTAFAILDDHDYFSPASGVQGHWVPVPGERGLRYREARAALRLLTGP